MAAKQKGTRGVKPLVPDFPDYLRLAYLAAFFARRRCAASSAVPAPKVSIVAGSGIVGAFGWSTVIFRAE